MERPAVLDMFSGGHRTLNGSYSSDSRAPGFPKSLSALLVYDQDDPVRGLETLLLSQGISVQHRGCCFQAQELFSGPSSPSVVITDVSLPDGTWLDVLKAARSASPVKPVIVVSRVANIRLYLDVLEGGAHDFVVPPFSAFDMAYIITAAVGRESAASPSNLASNALLRRQ